MNTGRSSPLRSPHILARASGCLAAGDRREFMRTPPVRRLFQKSPNRPALGETAEGSLNAKLHALFGRQSERRRDSKLALRMQFPSGCRPTPPDSFDFPDDALAQGGSSVRLEGIRGRFAVHDPLS